MKPKKEEPAIPTSAEIAESIRKQFRTISMEHAIAADARAITDAVIADLEKQKRHVTLALLGVDVDTFNHVSADSVLVKEAVQLAVPIIKEWVAASVKEILTSTFEQKMKKSMQAAMKRAITEECMSWRSTNEAAKSIAYALAKQEENALRAELGLPT
jgi:rRNA-processing protein FCF1